MARATRPASARSPIGVLGLPPDMVNIVQGDTDKVFHGRGTFGSRSMAPAARRW